MMKNNFENYEDGYYHFAKDLELYPDAWCYIVYSRRGPGKTYSALWYREYMHIPILYMKRTIEDVNMLCDKGGEEMDKSPYKPINRDKGTNIHAIGIEKGIAGFYEMDEEGHPIGAPVSFIAALNAIKSIKGFDLSECDWILLDEFIPQTGEIVRRVEGDMLLDVYMTVIRDRVKRGLPEVKLILFANAEQISTPITNTLEVVDDMADLQASGERYKYLEDKGILIHHITEEECPYQESEKNMGIYRAMKNTCWGRKAFDGEFANNDFSNVIGRRSLKNGVCNYHIKYKQHDWYIYLYPDGTKYMTSIRNNKPIFEFDLNLENDQKLFWLDHGIDLKNDTIENRMKFQKYTMYDLIVYYKDIFRV